MNLSKIKRVGFISNFNPKQSYCQFARVQESTPAVEDKVALKAQSSKVRKGGNLEVKLAKKTSNWKGNKPALLVRTVCV